MCRREKLPVRRIKKKKKIPSAESYIDEECASGLSSGENITCDGDDAETEMVKTKLL